MQKQSGRFFRLPLMERRSRNYISEAAGVTQKPSPSGEGGPLAVDEGRETPGMRRYPLHLISLKDLIFIWEISRQRYFGGRRASLRPAHTVSRPSPQRGSLCTSLTGGSLKAFPPGGRWRGAAVTDEGWEMPGMGGNHATSPPPERFYLHMGNIASAIFWGAARFTATSTYFEPPGPSLCLPRVLKAFPPGGRWHGTAVTDEGWGSPGMGGSPFHLISQPNG